jgi:hypothetical protein
MTRERLEHRREYNRNYVAARYEERRKLIDEIKVSRGCYDCGYKTHPAALQFDHINAGGKSFKIAAGMMRNWERILEEISKCVVRCANCHAVKTVEDEAHRLRIGRPRATEYAGVV